MSNRLEVLKNMVAQNPDDSFSRYGLAMEYVNAGDLEGAIQEYRTLLAANPNYSAAYYHGGQTLEKLGRREDARSLYPVSYTHLDVYKRQGLHLPWRHAR